jgi:hypothetical protein
MDKLFLRDWMRVILIIVIGGIIIGSIAKFFRPESPSYVMNAQSPCIVQQVMLPVKSPISELPIEYVDGPAK